MDGEEAEDAERDGDSESDIGEDPEVDDLGTEINPNKEDPNSTDPTKFSAKAPVGDDFRSDIILETPEVSLEKIVEGLVPVQSGGLNEEKDAGTCVAQAIDVPGMGNNLAIFNQEDADVDERNPGELWVQDLMEGEYSDLSVEERLNALVALIGVAIEGNSIRVVLEV